MGCCNWNDVPEPVGKNSTGCELPLKNRTSLRGKRAWASALRARKKGAKNHVPALVRSRSRRGNILGMGRSPRCRQMGQGGVDQLR
jgi:hypothetical protein